MLVFLCCDGVDHHLLILSCIEVVVIAFAAHQFPVGAAFDDLAVLDDQDHIGVDDRRKTMGNDEGCPAFNDRGNGILNRFFRQG